jgi:predicted nucleic acid-binding protein
MIHLDTSVLVDALARDRHSAARLRMAIESGERLGLSALVLYERLRGPRAPEEIRAQETFFPSGAAVPFGPAEAAMAAGLYREVPRRRARATDLAIAACAIVHGAALWTLNPSDFEDVPSLRLYRPR